MMLNTLKFNTVKPILQNCLETIMSIEAFQAFRLVGGTSLSLRFGHRMSDDIDLFTDAAYGTIDFYHLQNILRSTFPYCYGDCGKIVGLGTSYMIGQNKDNCVNVADNDPEPICLLNKIWPFIKLDFSEWTSSVSF